MKRGYLLNRFASRSGLLMVLLLVAIILISGLNGSAMSEVVEPLDFCIGVDHPPFEESYEGDGYSYLKLGLTMPLAFYDEGAAFTGELSGRGSMVTSNEILNNNGQLFFVFPLYAYGSYDVVVYDDKGDMVFQNQLTVDDSETECDPNSLAVSPPKEVSIDDTREQPSDATVEPLETTEETREEIPAERPQSLTEESDERVWWPLLFVGAGVLSILRGVLFLLNRNCEKERKVWLAAGVHASSKSDLARQAEEVAEKLAEEREQLEEELLDIRATYPSAGKEGGDKAWIEMDGHRITSRDVKMKREAERAAWDDYRSDPNPDTAGELQKDWKATDTPQSEEERRQLDKEAMAITKELDAAKEAEDKAVHKAKSAKEVEADAHRQANQARLNYEACLKAALAPPTPKPGRTDDPGGPSVARGEDDKAGCKDKDPPQQRNRRNLGRVSIPVELKVTLDGGGAHEGALAANDISGQLADISEKLGWISKVMDIKGIGESLVRDGVGWSLLGASAGPATGLAFDLPVPTSPGQLAVDSLSILGKISSVIIGKVPELQERRLPDCDVSATIVNNVFTAECVEIWVCNNGQWVKDRTRFTIKLISRSKGRMTKRRALTWAQAQEVIRRYEQIYSNKLSRGLNELARLEAGCK